MTDNALLTAEMVKKHFCKKSGIFQRFSENIKAVDGVSFKIYAGETLGLVGESGCGKSTLGRAILMLDKPTYGRIYFNGTLLNSLSVEELRPIRKEMQIIYQDPYSAIDPRMKIRQIVAEPLKVHNVYKNKTMVREKVKKLLEIVGLSADFADRYPHEFSGGQRQRISIARALALQPKFIVADEPVSALDVSIQSQIINLLKDLQDKFNLTYLFISHDLRVVSHISKNVAVMYLGRIIELAGSDDLYENPIHPYTKTLMSSIPGAKFGRERIVLLGEPPSAINPPPGCSFHPRCYMAKSYCSRKEPNLLKISDNHWVACHLYAQ